MATSDDNCATRNRLSAYLLHQTEDAVRICIICTFLLRCIESPSLLRANIHVTTIQFFRVSIDHEVWRVGLRALSYAVSLAGTLVDQGLVIS